MSLLSEQGSTFHRSGWLHARNRVPLDTLDAVASEYKRWLDDRSKALHEAGKAADLCSSEPFEQRFSLMDRQRWEVAQHLDVMYTRSPAVFSLLRSSEILDAIEPILGPEISCSLHVRVRPPASLRGNGIGIRNPRGFAPPTDPAKTNMILCWIPLCDSDDGGAGLRVLPSASALEEDAPANGAPAAFSSAVELPLHRGDLILLHPHSPRRWSPNRGQSTCWTVECRYYPTPDRAEPLDGGFIVRSRRDPGSVFTDHNAWACYWSTLCT